MRNVFVALSIIVSAALVSAEDANYAGWGDTSTVGAFKADSLKYSAVFPEWSSYQEKSIDVWFSDTAHAGFIGDSVAFYYWLEVGRRTALRTGKLDTIWNRVCVIDSVRMCGATAADTARFTLALGVMDGTGAYTEQMKYIDTTDLTGYAHNGHSVSAAWGTLARIGFKGLTGNRVGKFVLLCCGIGQRAYTPIRAR